MRIGKTILTLVTAFSVAILPAASAFASGARAVAVAISVSAPDCDHHPGQPSHHPVNKTQKNTGGCDSMADCAFKCCSTSTVAFATFRALPTTYTKLQPGAISEAICPQMGHPPFRPPRA